MTHFYLAYDGATFWLNSCPSLSYICKHLLFCACSSMHREELNNETVDSVVTIYTCLL